MSVIAFRLDRDITIASHGVRTVENLRLHCGVTDPDELEVGLLCLRAVILSLILIQREARRFEEAIVAESKKNGRQGIIALPGVREIMHEACLQSSDEARILTYPAPQLGPYHKLPKPKWAICTSATITYATSALKAVEVPIPDVFVVSEDVEKGKPE